MKIYIMGAPGSGKTSLSKILSQKYNIKSYELDLLVYDDENNHIKRSDEDINKRFTRIINKDNWIIEDVGRSKFIAGREACDIIYYLKLSKVETYKRVVKRWINHRNGKENYNYPPTFFALVDMIKIVNSYFKKENDKLKSLEKYKDKIKFLNIKDLNNIHRDDVI